MSKKDNFFKGFIKENPLFILLLGTCPALAITTSLENALGMSIAFIFVLVMSNLIISIINSNKKIKELIAPIRIAVYIVIIASLVTIVEMLMAAYLPSLYDSLGVFISLITVNCIVLGRAEAYASNNKVGDSLIDALGMGIGYSLALIVISVIREVLGNGTLTIWGNLMIDLNPIYNFLKITPISFFTSSAGAFMVYGLILAVLQSIENNKQIKQKKKAIKEVK